MASTMLWVMQYICGIYCGVYCVEESPYDGEPTTTNFRDSFETVEQIRLFIFNSVVV